VAELARSLGQAGFISGYAGAVDISVFQPERDPVTLAAAGLSTAGAAGLAADWLPVADPIKLAGLGTAALALTSLPFLEQRFGQAGDDYDHHHHHHDHGHDHDHNHDHHHHDHDHNHNHGAAPATSYAPKGIALAASIAFAAAAVPPNAHPLMALVHNLVVSKSGAMTLMATTAEIDYLQNIEGYRGYNLDWLIPFGLAAGSNLIRNRTAAAKLWGWLPLAGVGLAGVMMLGRGLSGDWAVALDREHRHAHTHHLSAFQRRVGDMKLALAPRPLRKWSLLAPLGAVLSSLWQPKGEPELANSALLAATAGEVAFLTGFRDGQRLLPKTIKGRGRGWVIGAGLAGLIWLITWLWGRVR
jgi:hypothetical protein